MKNPDKIILLRGLSRQAGHWGDSLKAFQKAFPQSEILTPDLPGAGVNHQGQVPWGVKQFIPVLREQVQLNPGEKNIVIGLSLGGMCAMEWVKQFPEDFSGAVIMNSSFGDLSKPWERMSVRGLTHLALTRFKKGESQEAAVMKVISQNQKVHKKNVELALKLQEEQPIKLNSIVRQLLSAAFYRMGVEELPVPVLALGSMKDDLVSPDCTIQLGKKISCEVRLHSWAGHELDLDDAEWVCKQIKDWCSRALH